MNENVYNKLREQLDQYSVGFPETESGVEMTILHKLFAEDEAGLFLDLSMGLETADSVASRTGRDPDATAALLERMAGRGLVFRLDRGGPVKYAAAPFVVGLWEFQLGSLDRELAGLMDRYLDEGLDRSLAVTGSLLRTIPVKRSVDVAHPVATHEDARHILRQQKLIAVAECICRKQQGLLDQGCDKPLEACFMFGAHAEYYINKDMARAVTLEEAFAVLDKSEEAGLVIQPYNTVNPGGMCNCCGDCCGVLRALNKLPRPVDAVVSNWFAAVDEDECTGCETCIDRCQMDAITMSENDLAVVDTGRCIGCGLCVTTCPSEALRLVAKADAEKQAPPVTGLEQLTDLAKRRGTSLIPLSMQDQAD